MENPTPEAMKIRLKISVDTSADRMALVLSSLTKAAKEEGQCHLYVDEIRYLGPKSIALALSSAEKTA